MNTHPNIYIAVVDDDDSICRAMTRLLRAAHLQPITYGSAEAFMGDAKHPKFDCLVLDIQLGGMSGLDLCRRLATVENSPPVVFITAHDDPGVRAEAEAAGCAAYFRKTDPGEVLLKTIRRLVGQP